MWAQQEQRSPARIVSGARSLKGPGNQGRGIGEGWGPWGSFFCKAASKGGLAKSLQRGRVEMLLGLGLPWKTNPMTPEPHVFKEI
jgi:hypothetical protein